MRTWKTYGSLSSAPGNDRVIGITVFDRYTDVVIDIGVPRRLPETSVRLSLANAKRHLEALQKAVQEAEATCQTTVKQ